MSISNIMTAILIKADSTCNFFVSERWGYTHFDSYLMANVVAVFTWLKIIFEESLVASLPTLHCPLEFGCLTDTL